MTAVARCRGGGLPVASGTPSIGRVAKVGEWARFYLRVFFSIAPTSFI